MKALSIRQPWAWAIACAAKTVENRTRRTSHTGLIAIHASLRSDDDALMPVPAAIRKHLTAQRDLNPLLLARGAVIGTALIVGAHQHPDAGSGCGYHDSADSHWPTCSPWAMAGQWHWVLTGVRALATPVPCRGALGLWNVPEDVGAAVTAQLDGPQ